MKIHRHLFVLVVCGAMACASASAQQVDRASADPDGTVRVVLKNGKQKTVAKEKDQVDHGEFVGSRDGRAIGWTEMFPNCCTSYPIPLVVTIFRDGRVKRFRPGMMIYRWQFWKDGAQVAFCSGTVHSDQGVTCELHDVASGRKLVSFEGMPSDKSPEWARALQR